MTDMYKGGDYAKFGSPQHCTSPGGLLKVVSTMIHCSSHYMYICMCIYAGVPNATLSLFGYGPLLWRQSTRNVRRSAFFI